MLDAKYEELRKITGDSGNDRRGLNMPLIRDIKIVYPNSLEEQENIVTKINNFLEQKHIAFQKLNKIISEYKILNTSILSNYFLNKAV